MMKFVIVAYFMVSGYICQRNFRRIMIEFVALAFLLFLALFNVTRNYDEICCKFVFFLFLAIYDVKRN